MKRTFLCLFTIAYFVRAAEEPKTPAVSDKTRAEFMTAVAGEVVAKANYSSLFRRWEAELEQRIQDVNSSLQTKSQALEVARAECQKQEGWTLNEQAAAQNVLQCVQIPASGIK